MQIIVVLCTVDLQKTSLLTQLIFRSHIQSMPDAHKDWEGAVETQMKHLVSNTYELSELLRY